MNRQIADPGAGARAVDKVDHDRFRLLHFVERLEAAGELETRRGSTNLADVAGIIETTAKAVRFERLNDQDTPMVANVLAGRSRLALAFGVPAAEIATDVLRRLRSPQPAFEIAGDEAPVQEVVLTGDAVDLTRLPVHLQHGRDGGPYISAALDFTVDPANGRRNVGVRRLMLRSRTTTGIDLVAPSDLREMYLASLARGERLPVSFVVGSHPIDYFAGALRVPGDEVALMAALRGAPLAMVKCVTNDIHVPADAEWVIEGYLGPQGYVELEGPFGEYLGYYGGVKTNPVFHATAITRRRDALFQSITIGGRNLARTDTAQMGAVRTEVLVWRSLESSVREPVAVYVPAASGGSYNVRIALRQHAPGEVRNAISAVFGSLANVKNVFVVDPDIDVFSDEQIEWALATRFQPDRDIVVAASLRTFPLDPSLSGAVVGAKAGFDLTKPFGRTGGVDSQLDFQVPEPPAYGGARFASIRAALDHGPKSFEELMAAIGSTDGREVVLALDALRREGLLDRDRRDGRYILGHGLAQAE